MSNSSNPPSFSASGEEEMSHHQAPQQQQQQQVPSTPQIRTSKELELSFLNHGRMDSSGRGGGSSTSPSSSSYTPTILYSHANAEDLGNIYPWCKFLSKMLGVNIMAYDYTGYGLATDQGELVFALLFCFWIRLRDVWVGWGGCNGKVPLGFM